MNADVIEKYAKLAIKTGINIQKGQTLVIRTPIECAEFARKLAEIAYDEGARDVVISWRDEQFSRLRYLKAPFEVFEEFPDWQKEFYTSHSLKGAAFLSVSAEDPEILKDVDPKRIATATKTANIALEEYRDRLMNNYNVWSIISIPTKSWARKVFPGIPEEEAVEKLWEAIIKVVRADQDDPVAAWKRHKEELDKKIEFLNSSRFRYLEYRNSLGTDLRIELHQDHVWLGGPEYSRDGVEFFPNMPTEEVFTVPLKEGVNGVAVSSMPLNLNGNLIEDFSLTFKDGRVVDYKAKRGQEILKHLIETDEGSHYLGEVALVPYDSPISRLQVLFYNTLFDENASCHLALGKAYPSNIKNGDKLSKEELKKVGVNDSLEHEDFMIGTRDLEIIGTTFDGKKIPVFKNGNFTV
ncbi:MAG TPA: aminopeptidase [Clostridiaceae bacterium]|nr:aminopeptidase [Clostridiaceae bacterium]